MMETKKNPILDYRKKTGLFFNIGLVASLLMVISAFEWKFVQRISLVEIPDQDPVETLIDARITEQKIIPPKPKVQNYTLVEVKEDPPMDFKIDMDPLMTDLTKNIEEGVVDLPPEKAEDPPFKIVEQMPSFDHDGYNGFNKYVAKHLKYPGKARQFQVEGKVFVQFIVERDGSMTDIHVVRGIGYGCDEEVMRVVKEAPKWEPGRQRGEPVRVIMILPITFRLN